MFGVFYAILQVLIRAAGVKDSASTLSFYVQLTFITTSIIFGICFGDGNLNNGSYSTLEFLVRAWRMPERADLVVMMSLGVAGGVGGYLMSYTYRKTQATILAPFEYLALVYSVLWGALVWNTSPETIEWIGIILIVGAGMYNWLCGKYSTKQTVGVEG